MTRFAATPKILEVDARILFDHPECTSLMRLGVVSDIGLSDDGEELRIQLGVGDIGQHAALMKKVTGVDKREATLSGGLSTGEAIINGWYDSSLEPSEALGIVCGVKSDEGGMDLPNEKTRACLEMSALALGMLLSMSYVELLKLREPSRLIYGQPLLNSRKRTIGKRIFYQ